MVASGAEQEPALDLRSHKKRKTRVAIQAAALELFSENGFESTTVEQIANRAEIGTATFFRYFRTKSDVVFSIEAYEQDELERAIVERPPSENDLTAVRHAVLDRWVPRLDRAMIARQVRAASKSPLLRGMSTELGFRWQGIIANSLAKRHHLEEPDASCQLIAAVVLAVFSNASNSWMQQGFKTSLECELEAKFQLLAQLSGDWCQSAGDTIT